MKSVLGSSPWQTVSTFGGTGVAVGGTGVGVLLSALVGGAVGVGNGGSGTGVGVAGVGELQAARRPISSRATTVRMPEANLGSGERKCRQVG
jgi:hypothetical protein